MHPDHHHHHGHEHGHVGHSHAPRRFGTAFAIATGLNIALVAMQVGFGIAANSVALLADAGHNFADVLGLLMAWGALYFSGSAPTQRYTYGYRSASILSALANGVILLVATGGIAWEAIQRLFAPEPVTASIVMIAAGAGILINGLSAWLLMAGQKDDINIRGAFLHLAGDAAVSAGTVAAGAAILVTGRAWIDPAVGLLIALAIVWATWSLLAESALMSLNAVPSKIDPDAVRHFLEHLAGVSAVHDLHIWALSTTETALTGHLVMPHGHPGDGFLEHACEALDRKFGIGHSTLQIETGDGICRLAPEHVV